MNRGVPECVGTSRGYGIGAGESSMDGYMEPAQRVAHRLDGVGERALFATRMMPDWTIVVRLNCGKRLRGKMRTLAMAQHKRARAVELLLEGSSYADVARQVGYTHRRSAHRAVRQALHDHEVTAIDQLREQEVERLDALQALLWPLGEAGDTRAAASAVRIVEQRIRLLDLEAHSPDADSTALTLVSVKATQDEQPRPE